MNRPTLSAVSVVLLLLAGCSGGGSEPPPPTHVLTGTITRAWGGALPGVAVTLGGAASGTDMTDASGRYTFPSVSDGTYTLRPALAGYVFTPSAPSVSVSGADRTQDFTADGAYTISGTVSGDVQGGVSIALSGGGVVKPAAISAPGTGAYAFSGIPDGTYTLTPTLAGYTFAPAAPTVAVSGASATRDFTSSANTLGISGRVLEGITPLPGMTVRLGGASTAIGTTDGTGAYAFTGLVRGQGYTVTLATFGYTEAARPYTLTTDVTDADFTAIQSGPRTYTYQGTLGYAGSKTGPVYLTVFGPYGARDPAGGTGLTSVPGPWSGRAFSVRNVQESGAITIRAWMDTLGVGRFNAGADPSVTGTCGIELTCSGMDSPVDVGTLMLVDPSPNPPVASPLAVDGILPGDEFAAVVFSAPSDADGNPVADGYRVYWNDSATVDATHTLGTIVVPAGPDFAVVHGLTNGTGYWFRVVAYLGGAPLSGQSAATASPTAPAPPAGSATVSGTVTHPAVASPSALYVVAQGSKGAAGGVWFQRILDPAGTQTAYTLTLPPGTYQLFAFTDVGDDGAVAIGEPAFFPGQSVPVVSLVAGPNAGPTVAIPAGNASAVVTTSRKAYQFGSWSDLVLGVQSHARLPLRAVVTGPGLRGPVDLGIAREGGGIGILLGANWSTDPILPHLGDTYAMEVTYTDGTTEPFRRPVTGVFGGPPGVVAPADGAMGVSTVPTFQWSAPAGAPGAYGYGLRIWPYGGGDAIWDTVLPSSQTSVTYDADGLAATPQLSGLTSYQWQIRAVDADGNEASYEANFATGAEPPPTFPTLPLYDLLTGPTLDGQRWQTPQYTRSISGGHAVLAVQADDMQARTVQGTQYINAIGVLAGTGNRVTTLRANVTVPQASTARTGTAVFHGGVRLTYQPAASRGLLFPAALGNVLTGVLELFEDGSGLQVRRRFFHCDDAACIALSGTGITVADPGGFTVAGVNALAPAAYDTTYTLEVSVDEATNVFTWSVQGGTYLSPVGGTADATAWASSVGMTIGTTTNGFTGAQLFSRVFDDADGGSARVATAFDDVWVGRNGSLATLWDDFAAGSFSPARWGSVDSDVWLSGGCLHLAGAHTTAAAGGGGVSTFVNVMYPTSFTAWQADLAIVSETVAPASGSGVNVGMLGAFYNDGTAGGGAAGDVRARLSLQSGATSWWYVFKCTNPGCTTTVQVGGGMLPTSPAHPLDVGTVHTLAVEWEAAKHRFTFWLDDAWLQVDPTTANPGVPAPVSSPTPHYPLHFVSTGVSIGNTAPAGTSAAIEATVSNVRGLP
jgi:hypothetical protein